MKLAKITLNQSLSIPKQHSWLLVVLLITVLAAIWTAISSEKPVPEDAFLAKPTLKESRQKTSKSNSGNSNIKLRQPVETNAKIVNSVQQSQAFKLASRNYSPTVKNMFGIQTWVPPLTKKELQAQQSQQIQLASQPQVAPSLPFKYVGKVEEEDNIKYFLLQQNKLINIEMGQIVDAQWRLVSEDAQYLNWIYVPFDQSKSLTK